MATHSQRLHHRFFHDRVCQHLQLDELVANRRGLKEHGFVWVARQVEPRLLYGQVHMVKVGCTLKSMFTLAVCVERALNSARHWVPCA